MKTIAKSLLVLLCLSAPAAAGAETARSTANDGNLIMEDVPPIPAQVVEDLNRYQNVRTAEVQAWTEDGKGLYITTRFGDVGQIHRVDTPGGARRQMTFYDEPIGDVARQPEGSKIAFTRDAGGSEFAQIFLLDPASGDATMLTDGKSRNGAMRWDRRGRRLAFQSTRRNGASNDVWMMNPLGPSAAEILLEAPDGTWWGPGEFSKDGGKLLVINYVSAADARVHLLDLRTRELTLLAGGGAETTVNLPLGFDDGNDGFWLTTDQGGEFRQLAWQSLKPGARPEIVTAGIPWDVDGGTISHDRSRMVFAVNENGRSRLYLMDTRTRKYREIDVLPTGLVSGTEFSPDDSRLALTLSTARTPSDAFVLGLGPSPLEYGSLERWTTSEVGGLDTSRFPLPELIQYPTFDEEGGRRRMIPAWVYRPEGKGPFPVIVSIHGGPESQTRPGFDSTYQMWMDKLGVAVVLPNVRGSNGYGKSYLTLDNGFKREDSVKDIGALLDWIAGQEDLDQNRVAVFGGSYGGYMVLASTVHYSDRLKAAVDVVGISNFVTFLENTQDYRRDLRRVEYGDERDPAMRAHLEKISPLSHVNEMKIPMFIVQGQNDPRVPVTESDQMVAALRENGQSVWYMKALDEGHGYRKKKNRDIYQQATVLFFKEHLIGRD